MVKELVIGRKYYFKIKIPTPPTETQNNIAYIYLGAGSVKYRINNGSWQTSNSFQFLYNGTERRYKYDDGTLHNLVNSDVIEIYGRLTGKTIPTGFDFFNDLLLESAIENPIEIELDTLNCEPHVVSKTAGTNLLYVNTAYGVFREEQNVLTPSIIIEYDSVPNFNYVYIPSLSRYYFVTGITLVRYRIYRVDLKVDVLCTYDSDIRTQSAYITRCENTYDSKLVDERRPLNDLQWIRIEDADAYRTTNNAINCTFNVSDSSGYNFVVSHVGKATYSNAQIPSPTNASDLPPQALHSCGSLVGAVKFDDMVKLQNAIFKDDTKESFFISLIGYPFDVTSTTSYTSTAIQIGMEPIYVLDSNSLDFVEISQSAGLTLLNARYIRNFASNYLIIADFKIPQPHSGVESYLDYEPHSQIEIFVPFVGLVKVNGIDFWNKRILVYYGLDISSGYATAYVYNYDSRTILFSGSCQIGTKIPMSTSNAYENERQKQNNVSNLTLGLISGAVSVGIGALSSNPIGAVGGAIGGVLSVANAIKTYTNAENLIYDSGRVVFCSSETAYYSPYINKVYIRQVYHEPLPVTESVYKKLNGYPLRQYTSLSSITGYTECGDMHYTPSTYKFITKTEIDEIVSLAKNGIIL